MKGITGRSSVDKLVEIMEEAGDTGKQVIIKPDQEPAMVALVNDIMAVRGEGRTLCGGIPKAKQWE